MKRIVFLVLLLCVGGVFAPSVDSDEISSKAEGLTETVGELKDANPVDLESGEVDTEKLKSLKDYSPINLTSAEIRIGKINSWLEDNATWLKVVFGMVPSLTWLFAVNLWCWLWFLVVLVLNADKTFGWVPFFGDDRFDLGIFEIGWVHVFGLLVFGWVVIFGGVSFIAEGVYDLLYVLWNYVLPYGILAIIVLCILFGFGVLRGIPIVIKILSWFGKKIDDWKEEREKEKDRIRRKQFEAFSEEAFAS